MSAMRLQDKVVVITGAGHGLGRESARLFASEGAKVVATDIVDTHVKSVAEEIAGAGGEATYAQADVTSESDMAAAVRAAVDAYGRLDAVVCNAGVLRNADFPDTSDAVWDEVLGVNLRGTYLVARRAWPVMAQQEYGRIVFTSSNSGLLGNPGSSAYAASKAALWGLTRVLALEGAAVGIRVNAIAPIAYTEMSAASRVAPPSWRDGTGDAWSARLAPEAVSPVVGWLAHEACSLTGEVLSVAGGRVARFFLGLTPGIVDDELTLEAVRDHEPQILAEAGYEVPDRASEESRQLYRRLMR